MRVSGIPFVQGRNSYDDRDSLKFGIAIHNTSNDAPATGEAAYATRRVDGTSSHFYVDRLVVIQSLDTSVKAGHAGSREGNDNAVAVEIVGTNSKPRQWWLDNVCWDKLGVVLAQVVRQYGIAVRRASVAEMKTNPKVRAFYSHDDMRRAWGGTTHTDPGPAFCWDRLFEAVNTALGVGPVAAKDRTWQALDPYTLPVLRLGDNDDRFPGWNHIQRAQKLLDVAADGDYGPKTAQAVKALGFGNGRTIDLPVWVSLYGLSQNWPTPAAPPK